MTEASFITLAQKRYQELQALNMIESFYDYEKEFDKIWQDLGRAVLEANVSEVPADRRKKKHLQNMEKSASTKSIILAKAPTAFK